MTALVLAAACIRGGAFAADLSPAKWEAGEHSRLDRLEERTRPEANQIVEGDRGFVAGTMSPTAVRVGVETLRQGGNAADAAVAVALTQTARALGSFISYAGIAQILYFDAKTGKVSSLDAGWATYLGETELSLLSPDAANAQPGRKTLVPGFMAGLGALHERFGVLPWHDLFAPAIWYAEKGVPVSSSLAGYFRMREKELSRTEAGRKFLLGSRAGRPAKGDLFVQPELAQTLRAVAVEGARHMYSGAWGQHYVAAVRRDGGRVTQEDMDRYTAVWQEPLSTTFAGHTVFGPGATSEGGHQTLFALNLIEELKIDRMLPYWADADSFRQLSRVVNIADLPSAWMLDRAKTRGVTLDPKNRATKSFAAAFAPLVENFFQRAPEAPKTPPHTAGIVVIDREGNVAAVVHSINTVVWGTTGIVVDGVPVSDPVATNPPSAFASRRPGERLTDLLVPLIATHDGRATLAVAVTGSVQSETSRMVLGTLGYRADLETLMTAPGLLTANGTRTTELVMPEQGYSPEFLRRLKASGATFQLFPPREAKNMRGVGVFVVVDPTGRRRSVEDPDLFAFSAKD